MSNTDFKSIISNAFNKKELTKEVEINGVTFLLKGVNTKDDYAIADILSRLDSPEDAVGTLADVRTRTIASMLHSINGNEIPSIVEVEGNDGDPVKKEKIIYLVELMEEWPATLVSYLFTVCSDFKRELRKSFKKSMKYEWFGEDIIEEKEKEEKESARAIRAEEEYLQKMEAKEVELANSELEEAGSSFVTPEEEGLVPDVSVNTPETQPNP